MINSNEYSQSFLDPHNHLQVQVDLDVDLKYGMCFQVSDIMPIENKQFNDSSFDYKRYMKSKQIYYTANAQNIVSSKTSIWIKIKNYRKRIIEANCQYANKVCNYANALLLGENKIDSNTKAVYGQIGISAIFAISGMHIAIIYDLILSVFARLRIIDKWGEKIGLIILFCYTLLAGSSPPINRAYIMMLTKVGFGCGRRTSFLIAILISVLSNPYNLLNYGYLISYVLTAAIIHIPRNIYEKSKFGPLIFASLCYLIVLPISYSFNYTFNMLSPLAMLLFTPVIVGLLMPLSFLLIIIPNQFLITLMYSIINIIETFADLFDKFTIVGGHVSFVMWIGYALILYLGLRYQPKILLAIILWFGIVATDITLSPVITFVDVGQGDSAIIETFSKNYLVDVGNHPNEVWKQIKYLGISSIDDCFISHGHLDHYGGLPEIGSHVRIKNVFELKGNRVIRGSIAVDKVYEDKLLTVIPYYGSNPNDRELVVKFKFGDTSVLFPGDIELESENYLVNNYCSKLNSSIIKVPHHGSKTSSSDNFLNCVNPKLAIISSGRNNIYKHPSMEIVEKYQKRSKVYNTQRVGEIQVKIKRKKIIVSPHIIEEQGVIKK